MKTAILFDLGQTLAHYYDRPEIPQVLRECIDSVQKFLHNRGFLTVSQEEIWKRVDNENREAIDYLVRPLEDRLARIFDLTNKSSTDDLVKQVCRHFMIPIFSRGRLYEDAIPSISKLKSAQYKIALISNTPWGSPADMWRKELERLGIMECFDAIVFCRDVGWRKPAPQIFTYTLHQLQVPPEQCLFVGDNPVWDIEGPQAVGIQALLIDREWKHKSTTSVITNLDQLFAFLKGQTP